MYIALKTETFAKLFFLISFTGLIMYAVLAFYTFHTAYTTVSDYETYHTHGFPNAATYYPPEEKNSGLKYILVWTIPLYNVNVFGEGQEPFVKYNCPYSNCYLSTQSYLLNDDYRNFDGLLLDVGVVRRLRNVTIPHYRHLFQKFIFHSMTSSYDTPICLNSVDNYFNWTWTYKLSSDIVSTYFKVTDLKGNFVAPRYGVSWLKNMSDLTERDVEKLQTKKKAVAWVMDTCREKVDRMVFVKELRDALKEHSLNLDVFTSGCRKAMCPNDDCMKLVERDYFYYLVYERSNSEDFVSDEVLRAYNNFAVPIVRGGADYSHFLPEGSYLDAGKGTVVNLAAVIGYSIRNPEVYYNFHRWRNHYVIRPVDHLRGLCDLCEKLNTKAGIYSSYRSFRKWWYNAPLKDRCFPKSSENMVDILSYLNVTRRRHSDT